MKFCTLCDNFLYVKLNDNKEQVYFCKNCNNEEVSSTNDKSECVLDNNYINDNMNYKQYVSKYLKHDKTLPRVNNIPCPNPGCTKGEKDNKVLFVKYDFENMKYLYHCCHCSQFWITNNNIINE
jgi:DNA-directed RNA polymerase subunit M/transcription elongation factor TFIIS